MCMEDVRLGREAEASQVSREITNGGSRTLLDADSKRYAIIISPPASGILTLSFADEAVANQGINLSSSSSPLVLTLQEHGKIVTRKITAIHSVATLQIGVWYSTLTKE